jgi:hypothetical protein
MFRDRLRTSLAHVGQALRDPEAFALRWHREPAPYSWDVFAALGLTAAAGTLSYGLVMGLADGWQRMFWCSFFYTVAAGIAWGLPLPALYILNSVSGSRLRASTTFLAALVTVSWGGLAMIAAIPITWFFTAALPSDLTVLLVNVAVFATVHVALFDVFSRVMEALEPRRGRLPVWWLLLVSAIGGELFYAFDLFKLDALWRLLPWGA